MGMEGAATAQDAAAAAVAAAAAQAAAAEEAEAARRADENQCAIDKREQQCRDHQGATFTRCLANSVGVPDALRKCAALAEVCGDECLQGMKWSRINPRRIRLWIVDQVCADPRAW
jgi:hypothetical protein